MAEKTEQSGIPEPPTGPDDSIRAILEREVSIVVRSFDSYATFHRIYRQRAGLADPAERRAGIPYVNTSGSADGVKASTATLDIDKFVPQELIPEGARMFAVGYGQQLLDALLRINEAVSKLYQQVRGEVEELYQGTGEAPEPAEEDVAEEQEAPEPPRRRRARQVVAPREG